MQKLIVANIKMNLLTLAERERYIESIKKELKGKNFSNSQIVFCPPVAHIEHFVKKVKTKNVSVGAQNVFWEERGPYTGEISAPMLKNIGAEYVILGHSDRRRYFFENNESINLKIFATLKSGLKVILCVGEDGEQKKNGNGEMAILEQLKECLKDVSSVKMENITICYEPVWAISTNNPDHPPTSDEIMSAKLLMGKFLTAKYGARLAERIRIIYGGSVEAGNAKEVCVDSGMGGALVGKESLMPFKFVKVVEIINE